MSHLSGLQLRSLVKASGELEVSLVEVEFPPPGPDEVTVRVEASPINPSDLGLLIGAVDMATATVAGTNRQPVVTAPVPAPMMRAMAGRLDQSLPVGNEGAGVVIAAGSSEAAQALMGKTVAILGGAMYAQYRTLRASDCLLLPEGTGLVVGQLVVVAMVTLACRRHRIETRLLLPKLLEQLGEFGRRGHRRGNQRRGWGRGQHGRCRVLARSGAQCAGPSPA